MQLLWQKLRYEVRRIQGGKHDYYLSLGHFVDDAISGYGYDTPEAALEVLRQLMQSDRVHKREGIEYDIIGVMELDADDYLSKTIRESR